MSKLYTGSIDVTKIDKEKLYKGEKGTYLNLTIWINDQPDNYGNTMSIQQTTPKDMPKNYLGNAKEFVKVDNETQSNTGYTTSKKPQGTTDDLPF